MKKLTLLIIAGALSCISSYAQTTVTYTTGFDTPTGLAGWVQQRKGHLSSFSWTAGSCIGAPSAPNCVSHDYPVGGAPTLVIDWYVSPVFNFSGGGSVDALTTKVFAMGGSATTDDHFGIYLLHGSADPATATITLLADLTSMASSANTWSTVGPYTVPATTGPCYIAFKYTATNNWFVPSFDNLGITSISLPGPCDAPLSLAKQNITDNSVKLVWPSVTGATSYEYAVNSSSMPPASGKTTTATNATKSGLMKNTTYYAHVRSQCNTSFSTWQTTNFTTLWPSGISILDGSEISFHPNPVSNRMNITGLKQGMIVQVSDITGRQLIQHTANDAVATLNTENIPAGLLIVSVIDHNYKYTTKLIKQ